MTRPERANKSMISRIAAIALITIAFCHAASAQRRLTDPATDLAPPVIISSSQGAVGTLTFFRDKAAFRAVHPGLPREDFRGTLVPGAGALSCPAPLSSATADECFPAGGVIPGFEFDFVQDGGWDTHYAAVNNTLGLECVGIGPNFFVNESTWSFTPAVAAVGVELYTPLDALDAFRIEVFGPAGSLGASVFVSGGRQFVFLGVDTVDPGGISSIEVRELEDDQGEVFCNLEFGDSTVPVELQHVAVE